jgi:hypothetical protein
MWQLEFESFFVSGGEAFCLCARLSSATTSGVGIHACNCSDMARFFRMALDFSAAFD